MKKFIFIAALLLTGCAVSKRAELESYVEKNRPFAGNALKWSEFYQESYRLAYPAKLPEVALYGLQTQIALAKMHEAGQFSAEDFEYRRQFLDTQIASAIQQQDAAERMQRAYVGMALLQANAARSAAIANAAQTTTSKSVPSYVGYGGLQNQTSNGGLRYCTYSNGVVTTIAATSICPVGSN